MLVGLGMTYQGMEENRKAIDYYEQALVILDEYGLPQAAKSASV